jgi:hypothetical protein
LWLQLQINFADIDKAQEVATICLDMDKFLKNKPLLIGVVILLFVILGGGFYVLSSGKKAAAPTDTSQDQVVLNMKPEEIGLTLALTPDNKKVKFKADKLSGVSHLEWEFSYDADIPVSNEGGGEAGGKVTQSFGGETDVKGSSYESIFREIGTCSTGGKCRYDSGVQKVDILIKVTKSDGKVYQVKDSISL